MTLEQRRKVILGVAVLIVLVLLLIVIFGRKSTTPPVSEVIELTDERYENLSEAEILAQDEGYVAVMKIQQEVKRQVAYSDISKTARIFAERFGSYSNQTNFQNIDDVMYLVTDSMAMWLQNIKDENKKGIVDQDNYNGMITRVLTDELAGGSSEGNEVQILVKAQRVESSGSNSNTNSYYQDLSLILLRVNGEWKVDSAYWGEKY